MFVCAHARACMRALFVRSRQWKENVFGFQISSSSWAKASPCKSGWGTQSPHTIRLEGTEVPLLNVEKKTKAYMTSVTAVTLRCRFLATNGYVHMNRQLADGKTLIDQ